jgi:hypothetical protein
MQGVSVQPLTIPVAGATNAGRRRTSTMNQRIRNILSASLFAAITPCLIISSGLNTWQHAPALADDKSFDFKYSDSCTAEMIAGNLDSPCMKQETDAWLFRSCLKDRNGDADLCRNLMKSIACLDKWDDGCPAAIKATERASAPSRANP